jgi:peptidoglycan/xylan/chitin deacetylase (PgdA/CDA1 family)
MRLLDLYYLLKPIIPRGARLRARQVRARRLRRAAASTWPIDQTCADAPAGWPGWPEKSKFAFVLTHDVEGQLGVDRCRQLAQVELELGFRSSFNFIPEGEYETPDDLRRHLVDHGFEVGVHDLHHDGTLYRSRDSFKAAAPRINEYVQRWEAVGFRSGFMFHNLDWIQDLDVLYDASTFDTDPFEPQSDGARTIFPFWVPRANGNGGYVELPYSLPQDSTLFLVLGETTADVWKRKLDWVAQHGGMALVNVHPDYVSFGGRPPRWEFDVELYRNLLQHVVERYGDVVWRALPREVATYFVDSTIRPWAGQHQMLMGAAG